MTHQPRRGWSTAARDTYFLNSSHPFRMVETSKRIAIIISGVAARLFTFYKCYCALTADETMWRCPHYYSVKLVKPAEVGHEDFAKNV